MKETLRAIIYHPIYGRVVYDFLASIGISIVITSIFFVFNQSSYQLLFIPFCAVILCLTFWVFGIYTSYRTIPTFSKTLIIISAVIGSALVSSLFFEVTTAFVTLFFILSLATILPRIFLNFHKTTTFGELGNAPHPHQPVLVVGGGGYIGTQVVEQLLSKKYKVRVFDKFIYGKNVFKGMKNIENLELVTGDISDIFSLTMALKNVSAVIHLAGIVGDPASALDPTLTRHVNITSTRILKEAAKAFGIQRFIFASSCSVYGSNEAVVDEKSSLNPVSLYAQTKIDSEKELLEDTFDYFHPTILRFATVYGHSRKPRFDLVANLFVAQAFTNKKITVANGDQWRPFIHVSDVARAVVMVFEAPLNKVSRQIFNVGDDSLNITIGNLAKLVATISPKKVTITSNAVSSDKRNYHVSFKKIHEVLGFSATVDLAKGLKEIFLHFQKKTYTKKYTNAYYSNFEMTKLFLREFKSANYKKTHIIAAYS